MSEMGSEQAQSLERGLGGAEIDLAGIEPGELGPAEPQSSPEADAGPPWPGDPAGARQQDSGGETGEAGPDGELTELAEPGEAGPAEPATDGLPAVPAELAGDLGGLPGDLGQAAGTLEHGLSGDLGQVSGDVAGAVGTAVSAERVARGDAGKAARAAGSAAGDMAQRAGQMAESLLPGGDATGTDAPGLRLESPQVPPQAPRSSPR
ncbi:MAG TPA: hypothetical protein VMG38_04150 [Trebonia sp.]|nr:hypothetical protein [Trebonia sp.]